MRTFWSTLLFTIFVGAEFASAQAPLSYVAVTPCRVVDTRNATGPFGGPTMAAGTTRTFTIPQGPCNIPSTAAAYAFNLAAVPQDVLHYVTLWPTGQPQPTTSNMNDSISGLILSNFAIIPAGTSGSINVYVYGTTDIVLDIYGYYIPQSSSTSTALGTGASNSGTQNTAVGFNALAANAATSNTAFGAFALTANSSGSNNVAVGSNALGANALGSANTAVGTQSLLNNLVGNDNTSLGFSALSANTTGGDNAALGVGSLSSNVTGSYNTGLGTNSLYALTSGSWNIALGYQAGNLLTTGNNNIDIGHTGAANDAGVIRIGTAGSQGSAYLAGVVTSNVSGVPVLVNASGQLGIATSSARFKQDIAPIGETSKDLLKLRPVSFRYREDVAKGTDQVHFGLLAEDVAKVYPQLVMYDQTGQPFSIAYQELPGLLLNELQRQNSLNERQSALIAAQEAKIRELESRLSAIEHSIAPGKPHSVVPH